MKAVVLKVVDGQAMVLTEQGDTKKIKYNGSRGDEIELEAYLDAPKPGLLKRFPVRARGLAAAAAAAVVIISGGTYSYTTVQACSYVTLDVNPSFEYTLNRRDRVIAVEALNEDASEIVQTLIDEQVKGRALSEAVELTAELLFENGYFEEGETVLVSVTGKDENRFEKLEGEARSPFSHYSGLSLEMREGTMEDRRIARDKGMSTGKYLKEAEPAEAPAVPETEDTKDVAKEQHAAGTPASEKTDPSEKAEEAIPQENPAPAQTGNDQPAVNETPTQEVQPQEQEPGAQSVQEPAQAGGTEVYPPPEDSQSPVPEETGNQPAETPPQGQPPAGEQNPPAPPEDTGGRQPPREQADQLPQQASPEQSGQPPRGENHNEMSGP